MASSWDSDALLKAQPARLSYSIHSTSGVYASFHPDHIRTDNPHSDTSRWTAPPPDHRRNTTSSNPPSTVGTKRRRDPEWIILELDHTALVRTIGFGKTSKPHPCNLADFTLWGGLSPDPLAMEPLLDSTLKNDANPERFSLPISLPSGGTSSAAASSATAPLPVRYLKIDCHVAANAAYSISIWHVWLEGYLPSSPSSPSASPLADMSAATLEALYRAHRSRETTRLVLAHLRRTGPATLPAYRALAATLPSSPSTSTTALSPSAPASSPATGALEHPLLSALHDALVLEGDHARAEALLERMRRAGLLDEHCPGGGKGDSVARWVRLAAQGAGAGEGGAGNKAQGRGPSGRGGHAMVRVGRRVLLYGGWDGEKDLGDLWEWSLDGHGGWRCLDEGLGGGAAGEEGGRSALKPGPRSCHQMAVDEGEGWVYLLGGRRDELDEDDEEDEEEDEEREPGAEPASTTAAAAMDLDADPPSSTAPARPAGASPSSSPPTALDRALSRLQRRAARWRSDFWRYRAVGPNRGTWELLSADTRRDGGPALLFDHAMVVHSSARRLFVFGGKNQPFDAEAASGMGGGAGAAAMDDFGGEAGSAAGGGGAQREGRYSGMWCYDIEAKRWTHLFGDPRPTSFAPRPASPSSSERLLSRAGHALVLDESSPDDDPTLYVLHGQRNEQYLADEWAVRLASPSSSSSSAPVIGSSAPGDDALWRQGAVLDFPSSAPSSAGSLVDASAFPASSPSASPSRPSRSTRSNAHDSSTTSSRSRQPTIVQIRRLPTPAPAPTDAAAAVPPAGFTQRLTLGPHGTWTLLTGLGAAPTGSGSASSGGSTPERDRERERARERGEGEERCVRGVWRRVGGAKGKWERVKEEEGAAGEGPSGRYAAQVVYDPLKGEHYLFGGCPESPSPTESPDMRLSDFWKVKIVDPTPDEALRRAKFLVRKQRFAELCATSPTVLALQYLQNDLSLVVDHSSPSESAAFRACMAQLLAAPARMNIDADAALLAGASRPATPSEGADGPDDGACGVDEATYAARHALWEELGAFVPRSMRQPDERLDDAARLLRVWGMGGWGALGA
ncbi:hypothetical protein JCM9279_000471 [Rhodotorula babjevae]